ncbi:MAG: GAF domain-containing protein, partial [Candidatus Binatia bacterium]
MDKKPPKKTSVKSRTASSTDSVSKLKKTIAAQAREIREGAEQQAATSEILRMIARAPADLQSVMDTIAESAARLCDAKDAVIFRVEGDVQQRVAVYGAMPTATAIGMRGITRGTPVGRAIIDRETIHIHDIAEEIETEFSEYETVQKATGIRTALATPFMRDGVPLGVINIRRTEVRPFTDKQIKLLETFADQAVIAIENARLVQEQQSRNRELTEALEQQTATSEILRVIAGSPTDVQPVLDTVATNAARLCDAVDAQIRLVEGDGTRLVASFGTLPAPEFRSLRPTSVSGRAILNRETVHVHDLREAAIRTEFPESDVGARVGAVTMLSTPMLREGIPIGVINVRRTELRPFSDKQIKLLETFADQAVIAIENVRLFKEIQERNAELREALEHQTATAEVLSIISRSPTDVQPVLDAIVESAARVCGIDDVVLRLHERDTMTVRAHFGPIPTGRPQISVDEVQYRWIREHGALHIPDLHAQNEFPTVGSVGYRTYLGVPLLQQREFIGVLAARRAEARPFTPAQIKLLETFADQAAIALENVRLFNELKESLEQQTATSEILGVIASSPTSIQPVLDTIAKSAARICDANDAVIRLVEGNVLRLRAHQGSIPSFTQQYGAESDSLDRGRGWIPARAVLDRETVHIHDVSAVENELPETAARARRAGVRTALATPLVREGAAIGVIFIRRTEVKPFTDKQITLLKTFADQAVIAIENVRLFKELQERNRDLTEALEQQTATSEVLRVIASSPTELQPVLDTLIANAVRLSGATRGHVRQFDGEFHRVVAHYGETAEMIAILRANPLPASPELPAARAHVGGKTIHILDVQAESGVHLGLARQMGTRTMLAVPLLREETNIGSLTIWRDIVEPFSERQMEVVKTFADQAVIAIENVRLFQELKESLEQQTATSEILGVIASSPTDIQPVLNTVAANAARLGEATDAQIRLVEGDRTRLVASFGNAPALEFSPTIPGRVGGRAILNRETVHVHDLLEASKTDFLDSREVSIRTGTRTILSTPLLREGTPIGVINVRRTEVRPFSDKQIKLLETFADQAVIAIENVRLFKELDERTSELTRSVGELRALGEVSQTVSSTLDLETVLTRIVSHAVQLSGTDGGAIYEYDEPSEEFLLRATDHMEEELINALRANPPRLGDGVVGRAALNRQVVEVPNILEERAYAPRMRQLLERFGFRASLAVPLLREDRIIGGLVVRRKSTGEFHPEVIELLKTFATQSVLAIQNARLFREIEEKSRQIEAANRHKSEFLANMSHELRTPLNAIIGFSEVLGERLFGELNEKQAEYTDDILTSGRHLLSLINEILDLS